MNFLTAFNKEFLEQRRTRKFLIALVVLVLFGMTSPLMAKMTPQIMTMVPGGEAFVGMIPEPTINDAVTQYIKNITQFGILLGLVFSMGSMTVEKDKGTAAMILSKPMPRGSFLLAKFASLALTFIIAVVIAGVAAYYYTYFLFGQMNILNWITLNGLIVLYILVYIAITLLYSTLTRTQYVAIGLSFGTLIFLGILGSLPGFGINLPDALISNASLLMSGYPVTNWTGLWVSLGIIVVSITTAWLVFRKQEL
ncbi:MAG: ABC transporter permease subunit [Anaerolineaceae bacterium]|nr:ABC transporter permease subunit [Anaerolineaceae bacterium]